MTVVDRCWLFCPSPKFAIPTAYAARKLWRDTMDPGEEARRLFASGDYVEVSQEMLKHKYNLSIFPCRLYQSRTGTKGLILVCFRSRKGDDFGVNAQGLRHMKSAKDAGHLSSVRSRSSPAMTLRTKQSTMFTDESRSKNKRTS